MSEEELFHLCAQLSQQGPDKVVISGLNRGGRLENFVYERGQEPSVVWSDKVGGNRSGTGDVFCAILAGDMVQGVPFRQSVEKAARYIEKTIRRTVELGIPPTDGIAIEEYLYQLGNGGSLL
jgi:pyridoxine kinase